MEIEKWIQSHINCNKKILLNKNDVTHCRYQPLFVNPTEKFIRVLRRKKYFRDDTELCNKMKNAIKKEFETNKKFYIKLDDTIMNTYDDEVLFDILEDSSFDVGSGILIYKRRKDVIIQEEVHNFYNRYKDQIDLKLASVSNFVISSQHDHNKCAEINNWIPLISYGQTTLGLCWNKDDPLFKKCGVLYSFDENSYAKPVEETIESLLDDNTKLIDLVKKYENETIASDDA
uniref:Uncharacterized protein n=1 Tax=viral metagenome TaxID=1070528 RepID=A0A6C0ECG7_9ZZZZ